MTPLPELTHPKPSNRTTPTAARNEEQLSWRSRQATLWASDGPLGECRFIKAFNVVGRSKTEESPIALPDIH